MRGGAADYLLKPLDKSELFRLLDRFAAEKGSAAGEEAGSGTDVGTSAPKGGGLRRIDDEVKQLLEKEYQQPFDLKKLSERLGFSPSYVSKMFKQQTGETI